MTITKARYLFLIRNIMKIETFIKWLKRVVKVMTPISFFLIAGMPNAYWLAGCMLILTVTLYAVEYFESI